MSVVLNAYGWVALFWRAEGDIDVGWPHHLAAWLLLRQWQPAETGPRSRHTQSHRGRCCRTTGTPMAVQKTKQNKTCMHAQTSMAIIFPDHLSKVCSAFSPLFCIGPCLQGLSGHLLSQWSLASTPEDEEHQIKKHQSQLWFALFYAEAFVPSLTITVI